ncbi:MAG: aminoacyltransferase [Erysipelotrichaceae bacterium]|nr:aminoacyltransferase [Erysipelotrichaceae bacterium]
MRFTELSVQEYDAFAKNHANRCFLNAASAFEMKRANGFDIAYVGVKNDADQIVAASGIAFVPFKRIFTYAYCQRGYLIDYEDDTLLRFFHDHLVAFCKKHRAVYITCDPYVIYRERDHNGELVEHGEDHSHIVQALKQVGYHHHGFTTGFMENEQVRWSFVLDLSDHTAESLLKQMDHQTRWCVNKTLKQGIKVRELSLDELPLFMKMLDYAAETRNFQKLPLAYYEQRMRCLKENAKAVLAYLDTKDYIARMQVQRKKEEEQLAEIEAVLQENGNSKKYQKKRNVQLEAIETAKRREQEARVLQQEHGDTIALAGAFFIRYEDTLTYVSAGAYDAFRTYNGPYAIHWYMMQYALEEGIKRYDFYGISGKFDEQAADYGVFQFKQGFGGVVEEYVGVFDFPIKKSLYSMFQ